MKDEIVARALGKDLPISTKFSIEICNFIRGKNLQRSKELLKRVVDGKLAIPFKRFKMDLGHKKNIAAGRFPKKACEQIIKILNLAEANARHKGLDTTALFIKAITANKASRPMHFGRKRRRKMKRTHIELIVKEK